MGRVLQLYQLQTLDNEIDKATHDLAEITAKLGETEALKKARTAIEAAEKAARQAHTMMQDLDLEVKSLATAAPWSAPKKPQIYRMKWPR